MTTHFFALVSENRHVAVRRLRVNQSLQRAMTELFDEQADAFLADGLERVAFDGGYNVDDSEIFTISDFELPSDIVDAVKHPSQPDELVLKNMVPRIKSVFAGQYDADSDDVTLYFQAFNKARLLVGGLTILHQGSTFHKMTEPGLTLDTKLVAAYTEGNLYFRSYRSVNGIIDVTEYFKEATNGEIEEVLRHDRLYVDDEAAVLKATDSWMRKRFSAILASGILNQVTPRKMVNRAKKYDLSLDTCRVNDRDALVFPGEKKTMKRLLTFLSEGYFEGELSGRLFQTNSQRVLSSSDGAR